MIDCCECRHVNLVGVQRFGRSRGHDLFNLQAVHVT
jgi:hypothetical protein